MVRWTIAPASWHAMEGVRWAFVAKQDSEAMKVASGQRGPQSLRSAGLGCAIRGGLSFGDFSSAAQRKVTCRGSATHKYTPPGGRLDMKAVGVSPRSVLPWRRSPPPRRL